MLKLDFTKYLTKGGLSFVAMAAYDMIIDNHKLTSKYLLEDSFTFAISNITASAGSDLLLDIIGGSYDGLGHMLAEPLINGYMYMYLYNSFIRNKIEYNRLNKRDNTNNFVMAAVSNVLLKWLTNPIYSLFGVKMH